MKMRKVAGKKGIYSPDNWVEIPPEKDIGGRPSIYTQELADKICERLAEGDSMRTVSKDESMPAMSTMFKWLRENEKFSEQYARAKQESADAMAEEILDIADDGSNDWMEINKNDSVGWKENGEAMQRSRLRVDTRKWLMSKMKPKKYGDKLDVTTDGQPLNVTFDSSFKNAAPPTPTEGSGK